jgi:hypothetical protein
MKNSRHYLQIIRKHWDVEKRRYSGPMKRQGSEGPGLAFWQRSSNLQVEQTIKKKKYKNPQEEPVPANQRTKTKEA